MTTELFISYDGLNKKNDKELLKFMAEQSGGIDGTVVSAAQKRNRELAKAILDCRSSTRMIVLTWAIAILTILVFVTAVIQIYLIINLIPK